MNIKTRILAIAVLCTVILTSVFIVSGDALISPALEAVEKQINLKKCGVINSNISFSASEIDKTLYSKAEFIKIESLPDKSVGVLKLGNLALSENQLISREDFDKIVFSPVEDIVGNTSFRFSNVTFKQPDTAVNCTLYVLDEVNLAPVALSHSIKTAESISVFGFLKGKDPENDGMVYKIVSYPSHGSVSISGGTEGHFCYTPQSGYTGKDSFEYMVTDIYGNKSEGAAVDVTVSKPVASIRFDDLEKHWAHNSAIRIASKGLMNGAYDETAGAFNFNPNTEVTRGDFLAMALISAGKEKEIAFTGVTSFADDESIPMNIKSYAEYAAVNGIINGYTLEDGSRIFASNEPVTRAEAAVIVDRILALPASGADISVFADFSSVPMWADSAISNLTACGIFNGTGFGEIMPDSHITRAETAEILCNVEDYTVEVMSQAGKEKKKSIFNLFGLIG